MDNLVPVIEMDIFFSRGFYIIFIWPVATTCIYFA
jgi:hypothetical protein